MLKAEFLRARIISIHAPPRGATERFSTFAPLSAYFNSRPSARGDARARQQYAIPSVFQFTPLREGRRACRSRRRSRPSAFQFTPLREGRPAGGSGGGWRLCYFNSRPSARGDIARGNVLAYQDQISIHAPPRGATHSRAYRKRYACISIHAPPRGATALGIAENKRKNFNSRPSARGDRTIQIHQRRLH